MHAYQQVRIGDPLASGTLMGPLIDAAAVERYNNAIAQARSAGGDILAGGNVRKGPGHFVEPTIVRARNEWHLLDPDVLSAEFSTALSDEPGQPPNPIALRMRPGASAAAINRRLVEAGFAVSALLPAHESLEDIFLRLTAEPPC